MTCGNVIHHSSFVAWELAMKEEADALGKFIQK